MGRLCFFLSAWLAASASWAAEAPNPFDPEAALAYSQAAIGRQVADAVFVDAEGRPFDLGDARGKPLIVNLVFTACSQSCPVVVQSLYRAVESAQDTFGADAFSVVTIGFDSATDSPAQMRAYAHAQGVALENWHFLSGDQATIDRLTETLGFIAFPSPRGFDHLAQTSILDAEGRVFRQVYGAAFTPPAVIEPLMELVSGRPAEGFTLAGLVDRVRLFCTYYDPKRDRYRFDYSVFIALVIGGVGMAGVVFVLIRGWLRTGPPPGHA